ncbi:thiamine phosphate synthase [Marinisporobacter balticus]|uniref:Thiamine-phosphate synthase n=1 Tax=Marinisporobacter balticus TaxID=2018667 RepID=A0A4R2KSX6_9FIRM|nr:thiamine phosphate synthase [Marinisporobacter balticus]TCO77481.1 thiamine-phosphate pyrophosphorylase [Marinisporobacter balticus]
MLFLITNRKIIKKDTLLQIIEKAVAGGVDAIILREKDLGYDELYKIAEEIKEKIEGKNTYLIINGNLAVAKDIKADGYHVGFHDLMTEKPDWNGFLGVSVHSVEEAILAEKNGARYLLASHIFETACKKGLEPRGIDFIKEIKVYVNIPVIALGGIKLENVEEVFGVGVEGIAVMSAIMCADDPYSVANKFKNKICTAL